MPFDFESVKEFVRCPDCRAELIQDNERLICTNAENRIAYPIKDGIPVLLPDEGTQLSEEEWTELMERHH